MKYSFDSGLLLFLSCMLFSCSTLGEANTPQHDMPERFLELSNSEIGIILNNYILESKNISCNGKHFYLKRHSKDGSIYIRNLERSGSISEAFETTTWAILCKNGQVFEIEVPKKGIEREHYIVACANKNEFEAYKGKCWYYHNN